MALEQASISPAVLGVLVENLDIKLIAAVPREDLEAILDVTVA